jgi:hypothetical protein
LKQVKWIVVAKGHFDHLSKFKSGVPSEYFKRWQSCSNFVLLPLVGHTSSKLSQKKTEEALGKSPGPPPIIEALLED